LTFPAIPAIPGEIRIVYLALLSDAVVANKNNTAMAGTQ
jgi:hypothetical protein